MLGHLLHVFDQPRCRADAQDQRRPCGQGIKSAGVADFGFVGESADEIDGPARCHAGRFIQIENTMI